MSNSILQNAGLETFLNIDDFEDPGFEDDELFGEISNFSRDIWTNTRCNEMEDDDLPLTKYLLQFNEEERWDSEEELSVGGDSFEDENGCLGWTMDSVDLDAELLDVEFTQDKADKLKQEEEVKGVEQVAKEVNPVEKSTKVRKSEHDHEEVTEISHDLGKKQELKKKNTVKSPAKPDSVQSGGKSTKTKAESKEVVKSVNHSSAEPQKSLNTAKTQAEKAKQQRERKKKYVQELEDTIEGLKRDNTDLQQVNTQLNGKLEGLKDEIRYLKGVISNQSQLATILRSVANTPGISISCSVLQDSEGIDGKTNKRKYNDHGKDSGKKGGNLHQESNKKRKMEKRSADEINSTDAGVCVHVQSGKVSLEFCAECSKKANSVIN